MKTTYWKDIDNEFRRGVNGDIISMTNNDAIANSLSNIFQTFQGSRRMVPDFAMPMYGLLFEPIDEVTANALASVILNGIERWETRIIVEGLDIEADPDKNQYEISLIYRIGAGNTEENKFVYTDIIRAR